MRYVLAANLALVLIAFACGCQGGSANSEGNLVGTWICGTTAKTPNGDDNNISGATTQFKPDGTFEYLSTSPASRLAIQGTYSIKGKELTISEQKWDQKFKDPAVQSALKDFQSSMNTTASLKKPFVVKTLWNSEDQFTIAGQPGALNLAPFQDDVTFTRSNKAPAESVNSTGK